MVLGTRPVLLPAPVTTTPDDEPATVQSHPAAGAAAVGEQASVVGGVVGVPSNKACANVTTLPVPALCLRKGVETVGVPLALAPL